VIAAQPYQALVAACEDFYVKSSMGIVAKVTNSAALSVSEDGG